MGFRISGLLLVFTLIPMGGWAEPEVHFKEPEEFRLGVTEFRVPQEGSPVYSYIGQNIARLFLERLQGMERKKIGPEEREDFVRGLIRKKKLEELKKLDELVKKRDLLAFSEMGLKEKSSYIDLTSRIHESNQILHTLETLTPEDVPVTEEEKVLVLSEVNKNGNLLPPPIGTYKAACDSAGVDYLITGEVEEVFPEIYSLNVVLYGAISNTILFQGESMGRFHEFELLVDQLFDELAIHLVGREWAILEIEAIPKDAGIFINEELAGIGKARRSFIPPGTYRIEVNRPGYQFFSEEIYLSPGERKFLTVSLEALPLSAFLLRSFPDAATLYLGALRLGNTPLTVETPGTGWIGRLEKEGYKSYVFPWETKPRGDTDGEQVVMLPKNIVPWKDRIEQKREDFYRSLGWFVLSLPLPIFLYGYYENESFQYIQYTATNGDSSDKAGRMAERLDRVYYGYLGSLFLSGSLLFNAVVKLFDYIRTGEASVRYPD